MQDLGCASSNSTPLKSLPCAVQVPAAVADFPCGVRRPQIRQTALCDFLTRRFKKVVREAGALVDGIAPSVCLLCPQGLGTQPAGLAALCPTCWCDMLPGADVRQQSGGWSGAKGGEIAMDGPGQHVLERTSILFSDQVHTAGRSVAAESLLQVIDCNSRQMRCQCFCAH